MNDFAQSVRTAFDLIVGADAALPRTVGLSLAVSGTACMFAPGFGPICGAHRPLILAVPVAVLGGDPGPPWSVDVDPESLL